MLGPSAPPEEIWVLRKPFAGRCRASGGHEWQCFCKAVPRLGKASTS